MSTNEPNESYTVQEPTYLKFNQSLIQGQHKDLPNPYYQHHQKQIEERNDYSHPTANVIRSIIGEYGMFSTLTEEKLEEMIKAKSENTNDDIVTEQQNATDQENDNKPNVEAEFYKKKEELLLNVRKALGASTTSLDFVSLLISSVRPAAGASSMSPHLKQSIKLGSLSCTQVNPHIPNKQEMEEKEAEKTAKIGYGWKVQSLQKASSFIKSSVETMKKDLEKEKVYWKEVTDVLSAHEVITTAIVPVETHKTLTYNGSHSQGSNTSQGSKTQRVLAVKYGYGDSGSTYFDSGLALLKKGVAGHLEFSKLNQNEREKTWGGDKIVTVKLFQRSISSIEEPVLIGQSSSYETLKRELHSNGDSFVSKIRNSRFFIFENELFWHLMKEASSLKSHRIEVIDSTIKIELFDKIIQIENITIDDESIQQPAATLSDNQQADDLLKLFRVLLCANNYKNLEKQRITPVAMMNDKNFVRKNKNAILIRPVIMYTEHNKMIQKFKRLINKLLNDIGVEESEIKRIVSDKLVIKKYINDPNEMPQFKSSKRCYNNDPFLKVYSKMAPTSLVILKYMGKKIWIELATNYSTLHISMNVKVVDMKSKDVLLESTFTTKRDVYNCLLWILKDSN